MKTKNCELCGDPMPEGEEMFNYHGQSGPCPKPQLLTVKEMTPVEKLQQIYNDERNISLEWFWDRGVDATYGDDINGSITNNFDTVEEGIEFLWSEHQKFMEKHK